MKTRRFRTRRWLPRGRLARRSRALLLGGLWLRCVAWWHRPDLDDELAAGLDPVQSDELSLRAGQLRSARIRSRLAGALEDAVELADSHRQPDLPYGWPPRIRSAEVRSCRELLLNLGRRVRDRGLLGVKGLAVTSLLVSDGTSPLYCDDAPVSLGATAYSALIALDSLHPGAAGALDPGPDIGAQQ
jgi:hypothetical protein